MTKPKGEISIYGVNALRHKRAGIDRDIGQLKLQLKRLSRDIAKIDDVLRILAPDSDPTKIRPKKAIRYLNIFKQGELGRLLIGILRTDGPLTNLEIARLVMIRAGLDEKLWDAIRRRTRSNLEYLSYQSRVIKHGRGVSATWAIYDNSAKIVTLAR